MQESLTQHERSLDKTVLIETACEELFTYGLWDTKTRVKRWVKKNIFRRQTVLEDMIFWPTGLLAAGLWHCRQEITAQVEAENAARSAGQQAESASIKKQIENTLFSYFDRWQKKGCPITYLDDLLAGEVFLSIYESCKNGAATDLGLNEEKAEQYRSAVEKMAAYAFRYPTDETGSFPYRANQDNGYIFIDVIGLACPFLYEYGTVFEKNESMELAVKQIANFLAYGIDAQTGLPYHGYDVLTGTKYGIIGWGRAVGWLLRGMTGCMTTAYGAERLQEPYLQLIDNVIAWQRKDGYFSWQLQAMEGPADTSATGMICAALQEGIRKGLLQGEVYEQTLEQGIHAIRRSMKNGRIYDCSGECEGFSQYPQRYGAYPWALGPALMLDA